MTSNLTFGQAVEAARQGKLIARSGWNGKNMFLFMRPEAVVPVAAVKTLPTAVSAYFESKHIADAVFTAYFCMKAADNSIVNGWLASQTDMLATDWVVLN